MCGIVGAAGQLNAIHEKMFEQLLIIDQLRGHHSTGVFVVDALDDTPSVLKTVGTPDNLLMDKRWEEMKKGANRVMCGHNRYATKGGINRRNAHPFEFDNVTGVHNGTLSSYYDLEGYHKFDVDSECLYNSVDKLGLKETMGKISGAWAMVYWDARDSRLHFLRNKERPLYLTRTKNGNVWFWASELWMLLGVAHRNNVEIEEPYLLKEDNHASLAFDDKTGQPIDLLQEEVKGKAPAYTAGTFYGQGGSKGNAGSAAGGAKVLQLPQPVVVPPEGIFDRTGLMGKIYIQGQGANGTRYFGVRVEGYEGFTFKLDANKCPKAIQFGDTLIFDVYSARYEGGVLTLWIDYKNVDGVSAIVDGNDDDGEEDGGSDGETFRNHNGVYLPLESWLKEYGTCSWCAGDVDPKEAGTKLYKNGEVLCAACGCNTDATQYLNHEVLI